MMRTPKPRLISKLPYLVLLLISFFALGCASQKAVKAPEAALDFAEYEAESADAPLDVEVAQAFIRDQQLHVMVRLTPKTDLASKDVAVAVSGLFEGEVREEQIQSLADAAEITTLVGGESYALLFSLQAQDLSEYQVKASWGVEARELLASVQAVEFESEEMMKSAARAKLKRELSGDQTIAAAPTEVVDQEESMALSQSPSADTLPEAIAKQVREPAVEELKSKAQTKTGFSVQILKVDKSPVDCAESPCDNLVSINALLANNTESAVTDISLGMGLFWTNAGDSPEVPNDGSQALASEEVIDLVGVAIAPGQEKKIRVRVDRPVPTVPGGEFVPHLRLLSFAVQGQGDE